MAAIFSGFDRSGPYWHAAYVWTQEDLDGADVLLDRFEDDDELDPDVDADE